MVGFNAQAREEAERTESEIVFDFAFPTRIVRPI